MTREEYHEHAHRLRLTLEGHPGALSPDFLAFFFTSAHTDIDWSAGYI